MESVEVRTATLEDIPVIQALARVIYPEVYRGIHSDEQNLMMMNQMYSDQSLSSQMTDGGSTFLILSLDGMESGYCAFKPSGKEDGVDVVFLDKLYILPEIKSRGLGRLLVDKVQDMALKTHPDGFILKLDVNRSNPSVGFYGHLGFEIESSWDAPVGDGFFMNAYTMRKTVCR